MLPLNIRYLIAGVLILHGLGHSGAYWFFDRSWISKKLSQGAIRWVMIVAWAVALVFFVSAGAGLSLEHGWWRQLAVIGAVISLPVTLLYLGGVAAPNKLACVVVDIAILVGLLWAGWPSAELVGS